jgi:glycosyltransferase involved in cell wall biosynthesis
MRIVYVNWAPLWRGAEVGGGVNVYSQSMAAEMVRKGYDVCSISSGYAYNLEWGTFLKKGPDYKGVENYEIFNAPNVAPGFFNYETPASDPAEPKSEAVFRKFLKKIRPDVVHFQNIEGISARCIPIAKEMGARVIYSLHNYHPVCNQIYLLYKDREICKDFAGGEKCLDCIFPPPKFGEYWKRRIEYHAYRLEPGPFRDKYLPIYEEKRNEYFRKAASGERKNALSGEAYAQRRKDNIQAINQAHIVLAVSNFVQDLYHDMGIEKDRLVTCHIGSAMADVGRNISHRHEAKQPDDPINVVFLGIPSPPKGLPFFLETLHTMEPQVLSRIRLHIYAANAWSLGHLLNPLFEKLASLAVHEGYRYESLPDILSGMDVGVVPPIWWDNAPQVVFEMLAMKVPVIAAQIGGIPDFVTYRENGLLFRPGDAEDLADKLRTVVNSPGLIDKWRKNIKPMKTISEHADELESFYKSKKIFPVQISKSARYVSVSRQVENLLSPDPEYFAWLVKNKLNDPLKELESLFGNQAEASNPVFSIIMPVCNAKREHLENAVDSVRKQNFEDWELLICDDASDLTETRKTLALLKESLLPVKIIENAEHIGISESVNHAAENALGEFLVFLGPEDAFYPDALAKLSEAVRKSPEMNVFYADADLISPQGFRYKPDFKPGFSPSVLETRNYVFHPLCVRKRVFAEAGGMNKKFDGLQDYDFLLRLMDKGEKFVHVADMLYSRRETDDAFFSFPAASEKQEWAEIFRLGKKMLAEHFERNGDALLSVEGKPEHAVFRPVFKLPPEIKLLMVNTGNTDFYFEPERIPARYKISFASVHSDDFFAASEGQDVILFMHPEVCPHSWKVFLDELASWAMRKDVGITGGMIMSDEELIVHAGISLTPKKTLRYDFKNSPAYRNPATSRIRDTLAVSSMAMAVSASKFKDMLNDNLKSELHHSKLWDIALCLNAKEKGLRVVYLPYASAVIKGTAVEMPDISDEETARLLEKYGIKTDPFLNPHLISDSDTDGEYDFRLPPQLPIEKKANDKERDPYHKWLKKISPDLSQSPKRIAAMKTHPFFSILLPTYNSNMRLFTELLECIKTQTYPYFEVCLSDDASSDKAFREYLKTLPDEDARFSVILADKNGGIAANTNRAMTAAKGDFLVLCDHDDRIEPFALEFLADYINRYPESDVVYSDEDMIFVDGFRHSPRLQTDWNPDMFNSHMYFPHLVSVRRKLALDIGMMDATMDGAQDYDFFLRATEKSRHIGHIPMILYSWRSAPGSVAVDASEKLYAFEAGRRAIENAMERRGEDAAALKAYGAGLGVYRVKRRIREKAVSHIIEGNSKEALIAMKSIRLVSPIPVEIIAVIEEDRADMRQLFENESDVKIISVPKGSNRAKKYNRGAGAASFQHLFFSAHNVEILDSDYPLAAMEHTQRAEIGAVGVKLIYPNGYYYHTGMVLGVNGLCGYAHRNTYQGPGHWNYALCIRNYSAVSWDLMAVDKRKWESVKGFDETISFYEDVDFCLKLLQKGCRNIYTPYISGVLKRKVHFLEELRNEDAAGVLIQRYGDMILKDPAYHPFLSRELENFSFDMDAIFEPRMNTNFSRIETN